MLVGTSEIDTTSDLPNGEYQVTSVVDGDTIKIDHNGQIKSIRLIGIDTPELHDPRKKVECFAQEAANIVDEKISEHYVYLESDNSQDDKDKYSRYLRYVFLDDKTNLNLWLVENGFAYEYTYDVPYVYQTDFVQAEDDARQNNVGLWDPKTCDGER
ncbi:MAG TPA: thermonuclease family protein [bacterium]|nr:thermonuclease family protein [bacterium]